MLVVLAAGSLTRSILQVDKASHVVFKLALKTYKQQHWNADVSQAQLTQVYCLHSAAISRELKFGYCGSCMQWPCNDTANRRGVTCMLIDL